MKNRRFKARIFTAIIALFLVGTFVLSALMMFFA